MTSARRLGCVGGGGSFDRIGRATARAKGVNPRTSRTCGARRLPLYGQRKSARRRRARRRRSGRTSGTIWALCPQHARRHRSACRARGSRESSRVQYHLPSRRRTARARRTRRHRQSGPDRWFWKMSCWTSSAWTTPLVQSTVLGSFLRRRAQEYQRGR